MKYLLKKTVPTVRCPKYQIVLVVKRMDAPNSRQVICKECPSFGKETCGYIKCNYM